MKRFRCLTIVFLSAAMLLVGTAFAYADEYALDYTVTYDGKTLHANYDQEAFDKIADSIEPGDSITYTATYENKSGKMTDWFMKAAVLKTLENDTAVGGGYFGTLKNSNPDSTAPSVLFDNTSAGGGNDSDTAAKAGLTQLTSSTEEYFSIGRLKANQKGTATLSIRFDGESENNDYKSTAGQLMMQFAVVEIASDKTIVPNDKDSSTSSSNTRTGDDMNLILTIAVMTAALLLAVLAFISFMRDRKKGEQA